MTEFDIADELLKLKKSGAIKLVKEPEAENSQDIPHAEPFSGLVMLDTVTPEPVNWLWHGHIPLGKLTIIDGDPGLGKSTIALDFVARVSRGASMPDGSPGISGGAVLLTLEDGLADTIVPRLKAAGADLKRIVALQTVQDKDGKPRYPTIEDIEAIKRACKKVQAKIVVIDPIMAHLNIRVNSWRDQDMRGALSPLCTLADEIGVAMSAVRHLNKSAGMPAIYRGGGTIGIVGAARCAFLVAEDPEDKSKRIFANYKNNLAPEAPSLSFAIEGEGGSSKITWGGISNHRADALLSIPSSPEERSALDEGKDFLTALLSKGAIGFKEVQKQARVARIAEKTLYRAKKALNIKAEKHGYQGAWVWALPVKDGHDSPKMVIKNDDHLWGEMTTFEEKEAPEAPVKAPWTMEF